MPAKPLWFSRINEIISELQALPSRFVDRATIETVLGVGSRRAQQIMASSSAGRVGSSAVADKDWLIGHLLAMAGGNDQEVEEIGEAEKARRQKFARKLDQWRAERLRRPKPALVEIPIELFETAAFENLPPGVTIEPGHIHIQAGDGDPIEARKKLAALAIAMENDPDGFDRRFEKAVRRTCSARAAS